MYSAIDTSALTFTVPPRCQGKPVEYAYASYRADESAACILQRRRERGEPDQYDLYIDPEWELESSANHEFWNREPRLGALVRSWTEA